MDLNGKDYYYVKDALWDIICIIHNTGKQIVSYTYDTWGKLVSIGGDLKDTVGKLNPYRYRGYRYDTETGLYYLQSRYYTEWGRFINADVIAGTPGGLLSCNMFAYCANNLVNRQDQDGQFWNFIAEAVGGLAIAVGIPIEAVAIAVVATVLTVAYVGYSAYDWYTRNHITYADSSSSTHNKTASSPKNKTK